MFVIVLFVVFRLVSAAWIITLGVHMGMAECIEQKSDEFGNMPSCVILTDPGNTRSSGNAALPNATARAILVHPRTTTDKPLLYRTHSTAKKS